MSNKTIQDVEAFWEMNPLWTGESSNKPGSKDFFEEHRSTYIDDCFAGRFDERIIPKELSCNKVLDLGCGIGFWLIELATRVNGELVGADLTNHALCLSKKRCEIYSVKADFSKQNAESMTFDSEMFSHVNCQGVIHHTPNTHNTIQEIHRVLQKNGTASISVYYKNIFLRLWPVFRPIAKLISLAGGGLKGRGRENIYSVKEINEIVRIYDGKENPIGKAYSKKEFLSMLKPYFQIEETFVHFFPARSLPFKIPRGLHRFLDRHFGFMIYANLRKIK
ncbi:MAG: hypothetical protein A2X77_04780 [Gammaproteobacteria bacterium GWE2_42_36]|nr:MAG: hypothetical protein A2X77_04780 [Gammaproteobacteria bacterium GWE2_42_36]